MQVYEYFIVLAVYLVLAYIVCFKWTQGIKPKYNIIGLVAATVVGYLLWYFVRDVALAL